MRSRYYLICATLTLSCQNQGDNDGAANRGEPRNVEPGAERTSASVAPPAPSVAIGDVASCQPSQELSQLVTRWLNLADADGNGSISRPEANAFTNFLIGGFFFRADADANGVVTPAEGRAARTELLQQYPGLEALLQQARTTTGQSPFKSLASALDIEYGQPLSADEARKASQSALDELFRVADNDKNATITPAEARAAAWQGARALGQQVFRSADADKDGLVAFQEFQQAVNEAAKVAFAAADANGNQQLSQEEAAVATSSMASRLGIPQPPR